MSPEQAQDGEVDGRSDIFSFGAVLYEMVAGRQAFGGDTAAQRLASVLRDEPAPMGDQALDAPKGLLRIIGRGLRKNRDDRYQNITDVKFALLELKEDMERGQTPTASSSPVARRRVIFGAALAAGGAALSYVALRFRPDGHPPIIVSPIAMYEGQFQAPALSPDGKMVAFMWRGEHQDNIDIYLKVIGSSEPLRLTSNSRPETTPLWSRDGRSIAFSRVTGSPANCLPRTRGI